MGKDEKLDLFRQHKAEYVKPKKPVLVEVGPAVYLTIDGRGEPATEAFTEAIGAIYSVAFTIKMTRKFAGKGDYKVCPPEGQYWAPRKYKCFDDAPKSEWRWKIMLRTPEFITDADLCDARKTLVEKGKGTLASKVQLETIDEGLCVQVLHVGPYADEPATIKAMMDFGAAEGLKPRGRHHEIYLSDPRRAAPEKLKTLLRHPVTKKR